MHPLDEQLNDYVDGALDALDREAVTRHLEECAACALVVAQLQDLTEQARSLAPMQPPEAVWQRLKPRLAPPHTDVRRAWGWKPVWGLATAAAVAMAFLAGRVIEQRQHHDQPGVSQAAATPSSPAGVTADSAAVVRERVLLVAVGDHLERSQMVLVELANAQSNGALDISAERQWADELLASNRLYRQTAVQLGEANVASVLDDLERVLVEVARGPSQVSTQQLAEIQQRIEAQGILFKVKIIGSDARERGSSIPAGRKLPVS